MNIFNCNTRHGRHDGKIVPGSSVFFYIYLNVESILVKVLP